MNSFMLKALLLICALLGGMVIGMQQANNGMREMKGDDSAFAGAFEIKQAAEGEVEAAILGESVTAEDLKEKQQKLEEIEAFNFFSALGEKAAVAVRSIFTWLLSIASLVFNRLLDLLAAAV